MTSTVVTMPGCVHVEQAGLPVVGAQVPFAVQFQHAKGTFMSGFDSVKHLLSGKPVRRPVRLHPMPLVTNAALREAAAKHQPPAEWFEGEAERPF
jgi:hypothetical protein